MIIAVVSVCLLAATSGFRVQQPTYARPTPPPTPPRQDCVTQPGPFSQCTAPCGGGTKTRTMQIIQQQVGYGRPCPSVLTETVPCNTQPCAIDCQVESGVYGPCSATCGQGTHTKVDRIIVEAQHGGRPCPSAQELRSTRSCPSLPPCPIPKDCEIGYTQYGQCSAPCGGGTQTRSAFIIAQAENGGAPCPTDLNSLVDSRACNVDIPCAEPKNCEFVSGDFGDCSATCGQGYQNRAIFIVAQPENGGLACPNNLVETRPCQAGPCPQPEDCQVQYPPMSQCSATCGGGSQSTTGQILTHPANGGAACPTYAQLTITRSCGNQQCVQVSPKDCEVVYGEYSQCSASCGGGFRTRKAYIKNEAENGGQPCNLRGASLGQSSSSLVERIPCNQQACPVPKDCVVEQAYWSKCSAPCGGGSQTRQLTILQQAEYGGLPCPSSSVESRPCNTQQCASAYSPIARQPVRQVSQPLRQNAQATHQSINRPNLNQARFNRPAAKTIQARFNRPAKTTFNFGGSYQQ